jgi:predicted kinase
VELILIRGLPGSGNTTFAKLLARLNHLCHFEADQFFEIDGKYQFDATKLSNAHQECLRNTQQALAVGKSVVVSNTFSRKWEMEPYISLARRTGARLHILEAQGSHQNIHGVPRETLDRMRQRWEPIT